MPIVNVKVDDTGGVRDDEPAWVVPPLGGEARVSARGRKFRKGISERGRQERRTRLQEATAGRDKPGEALGG